MPLNWVRLDANVASHDKVLDLIADPSPKRWQALSSYFMAVAWSGGQGTDGFIKQTALPFVHGTALTARLLVKHKLWEEGVSGWQIRNFHERQEMSIVTEAKRAAQALGARKGNCQRHHGPDCGCWRVTG